MCAVVPPHVDVAIFHAANVTREVVTRLDSRTSSAFPPLAYALHPALDGGQAHADGPGDLALRGTIDDDHLHRPLPPLLEHPWVSMLLIPRCHERRKPTMKHHRPCQKDLSIR